MSSIPCEFNNQSSNENCLYSHEEQIPSAVINSTSFSYNDKSPIKNCTNTHRSFRTIVPQCKNGTNCPQFNCPYQHPYLRAMTTVPMCNAGGTCTEINCPYQHPYSRYMTTVPMCNKHGNCSRVHCPYRHPYGSFNGNRITLSSNNTDENIFFNPTISLTECPNDYNCQRSDLSRSSVSSSRTVHDHHHSRRKNYSKRSYHENVSQISTTTSHKMKTNTTINGNDDYIIAQIDQSLLKATKLQQELKMNVKEYNDDDDDNNDDNVYEIFNLFQESESEELKSQKHEFQSAIQCLTQEYRDILSSRINDTYDIVQLQQIYNRLKREFKRWDSHLPIYARRSDILKKLVGNQVLILKADTGSGKSTQTVQYLCDAHFADQSMCLRLIFNFL